jgi:hypothetical protein
MQALPENLLCMPTMRICACVHHRTGRAPGTPRQALLAQRARPAVCGGALTHCGTATGRTQTSGRRRRPCRRDRARGRSQIRVVDPKSSTHTSAPGRAHHHADSHPLRARERTTHRDTRTPGAREGEILDKHMIRHTRKHTWGYPGRLHRSNSACSAQQASTASQSEPGGLGFARAPITKIYCLHAIATVG